MQIISGKPIERIAIVGGGPAGLFMYKRLAESGSKNIEVHVFERKEQLGAGMPYSREGASYEHVTNVSDNEIPTIVNSVEEWIQTVPQEVLATFCIDRNHFNEYKVLPRLLFGQYLSAQFELLRDKADSYGIKTMIHLKTTVVDIKDQPGDNEIEIEIANGTRFSFDRVIICSGHNWPKNVEGKVPHFFDSPYPPAKLALQLNHPVAIKGSSLTAIDAIRTLARNNGSFETKADGFLSYHAADATPHFRIIMHSRSGLLPAVRFHLEDTHLNNKSILTEEEIKEHIAANGGFLSLDYVFEKDFKIIFREHDPAFYERIKDMSIEKFVSTMMELRETLDPFQLLKAEYAEAEKSIKRKESVYWKEMLAVLSFAMNYPAKYLSAEDMLRLKEVLMPLISVVIAFVPQSSCKELLALHQAGALQIIPVGDDSSVEQADTGAVYHFTDENNNAQSVQYQTYVDCVGQPHLSWQDFPFKSMTTDQTISPAKLRFKSTDKAIAARKENKPVELGADGHYYLQVPGISINDNFNVIDQYGAFNERIFIMAVPYIGGFNPDYSGLDFCEAASEKIVKKIFFL